MTAPERSKAFRTWAISMCVLALHWGIWVANFGMLMVHDGKLLIDKDRGYDHAYFELPAGLTIAAAIQSVLGWLSIPVMFISLLYIREKFNYKDKRFKKHAGIAFFCAISAFILGLILGRFVSGFASPYTP